MEYQNNNKEYDSKITLKKSSYNGLIITVILSIGIATFLAGWLFASSLEDDKEVESNLKNIDKKLDLISEKIATNTNAPRAKDPNTQPQIPKNISIEGQPIKGEQSAPITIIEFSDFQCPFCARFYKETLPLIERNYIEKGIVKFAYRDFPIDSIHSNARTAHIAAECAYSQGLFWQYHDILFERQQEWAKLEPNNLVKTLTEYADDVGVNKQSFEDCLRTPSVAAEVQEDLLDGRQHKVTGTPTFFIGDRQSGFVKVSGAKPFEVFEEIITSKTN